MTLRVCFLSLTHRYDDNRILHKEGRTLAAAGFEVTHLAPASDHDSDFFEHGVRIGLYPQQTGIVGRFRKFLQLYRLAVQVDADCYHCNEVESWVLGCLLKVFHPHKRIVFDVHEHYPSRFAEPRFPKGLHLVGEPFIRLLFWILTPMTDHLVFAKRNIAPDFPNADHKRTFVFNYAPLWLQSRKLQDVPPEIRQEFAGRSTAIHIGAFGRARGWPQLLEALALMECQDLEVLCLGPVHEGEDVLLAEAQRLGVADRIRLKGLVPYHQMFDYLLCADIGLMLYQPGIQNHVFAFPIKMYDYMLAGLPVIGPEFAVEVEPVVREEKCGILLNTSQPQEISSALDWACANPERAREMGNRGRQAVLGKYNWESEADKLLQCYADLLSRH